MADLEKQIQRELAIRERDRIEGVVRIEARLAPGRLATLEREDPTAYDELAASGLIERDPSLAGQLAAMALRMKRTTPEEQQRIEQDVEAFSARKRMTEAGVPAELARAVIDGRDARGHRIEERAPFRDLLSTLATGSRIVILAGVAGTGKSLAAAQWVRRFGGSWASGEVIAGLSLKMSTDRAIYADLQLPGSNLVIDDLGIVEGGPIDSLMVRRFDAGCITVCTMNVPRRGGDRAAEVRASIAKVAGERTISRIRSDGGLVICDELMRGVSK